MFWPSREPCLGREVREFLSLASVMRFIILEHALRWFLNFVSESFILFFSTPSLAFWRTSCSLIPRILS